ncbi:MAG: formate dehydrogenase accessory protein FdhE [Lautropia sp.]|nr:formate dehydrogenase accessory protein FdhE [Lautropia sp.]
MQQRILQPGEIEALDRTAFPRIRLPQPGSLFLDRSHRLGHLAAGSPLEGFLRYVARLMAAQHEVSGALRVPAAIDDAVYERAQRFAVPLWQVPGDLGEGWRAALDGLLKIMRDAPETGGAQVVQIDELQAMDDQAVLRLVDAVMMGAPLNESRRAKAPFVMAAVQVVMSTRAATLDLGRLPYVDPPTVCPVCSSHPVASVIRIDGQSAGLRYLHCGICATEWHMVRVKCSNCASTKGISYRRMDGRAVVPQPGSEQEGGGETAASVSGTAGAGLAPSAGPRPESAPENPASGPAAVGRTVSGMAAGPVSSAANPDEAASACMAELCDNCGSYRKIFDLQKDHAIEALSDDLATLMLDILMGEENHARAGLNPFLYMDAEAGDGVEAVPGADARGDDDLHPDADGVDRASTSDGGSNRGAVPDSDGSMVH